MHILKADIFTLEKPDISILELHFLLRITAIMLNSGIISPLLGLKLDSFVLYLDELD